MKTMKRNKTVNRRSRQPYPGEVLQIFLFVYFKISQTLGGIWERIYSREQREREKIATVRASEGATSDGADSERQGRGNET